MPKRSDMCSENQNIFNFAFLDLETTGLPSDEQNKTRITELSITVVESKHIVQGICPRVRNKLNLCFNPYKLISAGATKITGLDNFNLENQTAFSVGVVDTINEFLNLQKKPICLVAHNGYKFDYPILRAEIIRVGGMLNEDILCIDSLLYFKDVHKRRSEQKQLSSECICTVERKILEDGEPDVPEVKKQKVISVLPTRTSIEPSEVSEHSVHQITTKEEIIQGRSQLSAVEMNNSTNSMKPKRTSFKLCDIYKRLTFKDPVNSHHAEGDVDCLIDCAAVFGNNFVEWANQNTDFFSNIPSMRPVMNYHVVTTDSINYSG